MVKYMQTKEQKACNAETLSHILQVGVIINKVIRELLTRAEHHDASKLSGLELDGFVEWTEKLHSLTYGTPEYQASLDGLQPALRHHYARNRHHPQHFKNGVDDMNLIDVMEMLCDWMASSYRQDDGNIRLTLKVNAERFGIGDQLAKILDNTIDELDEG